MASYVGGVSRLTTSPTAAALIAHSANSQSQRRVKSSVESRSIRCPYSL